MLFETIKRQGQKVIILDQTKLPLRWEYVTLHSMADMANAISCMLVRGAPLIGASAAYGIALAMQEDPGDTNLAAALRTLAATRPTAVNLHWALRRMQQVLTPLPEASRPQAAWQEADRIRDQDIDINAEIGRHGLHILQALATHERPLNIMTHCNAGALATCGWGTALAPIFAAARLGMKLHVWVSETRPRNQGYLTAAELSAANIPHTLIADNAAGLLVQQGSVDVVITGADRIAANGDAANKVGTYLKALAAKASEVPFYIAAPWSTIDLACPQGSLIPIEERSANELRRSTGQLESGETAEIGCIQASEAVFNPAFDITPATLITGIITESGLFKPDALRPQN